MLNQCIYAIYTRKGTLNLWCIRIYTRKGTLQHVLRHMLARWSSYMAVRLQHPIPTVCIFTQGHACKHVHLHSCTPLRLCASRLYACRHVRLYACTSSVRMHNHASACLYDCTPGKRSVVSKRSAVAHHHPSAPPSHLCAAALHCATARTTSRGFSYVLSPYVAR